MVSLSAGTSCFSCFHDILSLFVTLLSDTLFIYRHSTPVEFKYESSRECEKYMLYLRGSSPGQVIFLPLRKPKVHYHGHSITLLTAA
jgi:hypothetical protein